MGHKCYRRLPLSFSFSIHAQGPDDRVAGQPNTSWATGPLHFLRDTSRDLCPCRDVCAAGHRMFVQVATGCLNRPLKRCPPPVLKVICWPESLNNFRFLSTFHTIFLSNFIVAASERSRQLILGWALLSVSDRRLSHCKTTICQG